MKLRMIALAGVTAAALSSPAFAEGEGWYLGLGGGYAAETTVNLRTIHGPIPPVNLPVAANYPMSLDNGGIIVPSVGYKWDNFRVEIESAYSSHSVSSAMF